MFTLKDIKGAVVEKIDGLLPCPFCGRKASVFHNTQSNLWTVECYDDNEESCDIDAGKTSGFAKEEEAINTWNERFMDAQSSVKLRLNRKKLANLIYKTITDGRDGSEKAPLISKPVCLELADVIISADKKILEVVGE